MNHSWTMARTKTHKQSLSIKLIRRICTKSNHKNRLISKLRTSTNKTRTNFARVYKENNKGLIRVIKELSLLWQCTPKDNEDRCTKNSTFWLLLNSKSYNHSTVFPNNLILTSTSAMQVKSAVMFCSFPKV